MLKRLSALVGLIWLVVLGAPVAAAGPDTATTVDAGRVHINAIDLAVIFAYLVGIITLGCWAGMRRKQAAGSDYFLAGRSLSWTTIGLALFATNISTIHLVSFAQNGYTSGLTYGNYEWMAAFTLVILSLFFAPFYLRSSVATLPDFIEKRYSRGSRNYLAVLSIFSAVVVHIGFSLHTGAIVLKGTLLPAYIDNPDTMIVHFWTIIALCAVTAVYTIVGGLLAVVLTESLQTIIMLVGSVCILLIGLDQIGGWENLQASVHPVNLTVLRPSADPTGVTWYAVFLGYPVLGIWYWCTDQTIVQRVLGAKDENHARVGPLFAGFIKILPVFLFVLPGIVALGLVERGAIAPLPTNADGSLATEKTYTHLINTLLPPGLRGVVIAAMLAALMSTVSGALNSIATLFSYDIYRRWRPDTDERRLVRIGRVATFVATCVAIAWSMALGSTKATIFQAMVDVFPVVAPPTAVVFVWGVFWRRASAKAAFWTLIGGSCVGLVIFVGKTLVNNGTLELSEESLVGSFLAINSLFMAFILFVAESVFLVAASMLFPHTHTAESEALVWSSPWHALRRDEHTWRGLLDYRVLAAALVVTMVALYVVFSGGENYYPVEGKVTLNDQPVIGAAVYLDTDDARFDAAVSTGIAGKYASATTERAGGAPAGTQYRVRVEPKWDYIVAGEGGKPQKILAAFPAGTPVAEEAASGATQFLIQTEPPQTVKVDSGTRASVIRATPIPEKYRDFASSGLSLTVAERATRFDLILSAASERPLARSEAQ